MSAPIRFGCNGFWGHLCECVKTVFLSFPMSHLGAAIIGSLPERLYMFCPGQSNWYLSLITLQKSFLLLLYTNDTRAFIPNTASHSHKRTHTHKPHRISMCTIAMAEIGTEIWHTLEQKMHTLLSYILRTLNVSQYRRATLFKTAIKPAQITYARTTPHTCVRIHNIIYVMCSYAIGLVVCQGIILHAPNVRHEWRTIFNSKQIV